MYDSPYLPVPMNQTVFNVTRGILCQRVQEQWPEIKKISEKINEDELKKFVSNLKVSDDFSGIFHRNTFKVTHPVGITGLGFFGPEEIDIAEYDVSIQLEHLRNLKGRHQTLLVANYFGIPAQKGAIFRIQLEKVLVCKPNIFYNVCFQLDGPKTGICDPVSLQNDCIHSAGDTQIEFSFLKGSLQMPEMQYVLL